MCAAWNADATLTDKLVESGWIKNDGGRGFKLMQIYRSDCAEQRAHRDADRAEGRQGAVRVRRRGRGRPRSTAAPTT